MRIRAFLFIYSIHISRFYFADITQFDSFQLHGFSDASEDAYAAVVYICSQDRDGSIGISLVIAKLRVSFIKRLSIPRLELCGAHLLSQLLHYFKNLFHLSLSGIHAWTDSSIVLNWLQGSLRCLKSLLVIECLLSLIAYLQSIRGTYKEPRILQILHLEACFHWNWNHMTCGGRVLHG